MRYRPKSGWVVVERVCDRLFFLDVDGHGSLDLSDCLIYEDRAKADDIAARYPRGRVLRVRSVADQKRRAYLLGRADAFECAARWTSCRETSREYAVLQGAALQEARKL